MHQLKSNAFPRREKRVGRGGKRGKTSGRGTKGQKARAGHRIRPAFRDIVKKLPKRRGYRFRSFRPRPAVVGLRAIARTFPDGALIQPQSLLSAGLIRRMKGRVPAVKILGHEAISKRLTFRGVGFSRRAQALVEAAGGAVR